jgi:hypothetical protein
MSEILLPRRIRIIEENGLLVAERGGGLGERHTVLVDVSQRLGGIPLEPDSARTVNVHTLYVPSNGVTRPTVCEAGGTHNAMAATRYHSRCVATATAPLHSAVWELAE